MLYLAILLPVAKFTQYAFNFNDTKKSSEISSCYQKTQWHSLFRVAQGNLEFTILID